ncbi:hypothetical protein FQR65_LT02382 [Abscondita terminalis]|nr:hypothetical protein FQR65_LT02382 [Abscondita terminalis]
MNQEKTISNKRVFASQVSAVLVKNLLIFSMGMSLAHITIMIPALANDPMFMINKEEASWIGSINFVTILVGAASSGFLTQKLGRKTCMQLSTIPLMACWINLKFCTHTWQVFVSIIVSGCTFGLTEAPVTSYVAEVTQPHVRGLLAAMNSVTVSIGLVTQFTLRSFLSWRNAAAVSSVVPLMTCILLFFVPESPHWLIMHNRLVDGQKSLAWLRGWATPEITKAEFEEMCHNHKVNTEVAQEDKTKTRFPNMKMCFRKSFCWPFSIMFLVCFVAGFSGYLSLQTYAVNVFATFKVPINQYYATVILSVSQFTGCVLFIALIKYLGKRMVIFISLSGCAVFSCSLGLYAYIHNAKYLIFREADEIVKTTDTFNWLPLVLLPLLAVFYSLGIKGVQWVLMGEVFSHETRAIGCGLIGAISSGCIFIANKTYWKITDYLTFPVVLWINTLINVIGIISLYFLLPETEGKTLEECSNHFLGISKLDNKVKKRVVA